MARILLKEVRRPPEIAGRGSKIALHINQPQRQERIKSSGDDELSRRLRSQHSSRLALKARVEMPDESRSLYSVQAS
jgi:hypothetical protein